MKRFSRRAVLTGAGITLGLPWLSSLAGAQAQPAPLRFLPIFFPNGAPDLWKPTSAGRDAQWQLSSILEPLSQLKTQVTVISGLENGSVFNADGSPSVETSHGRQAGAWLTCRDAKAERRRLGVDDANGISADQVLAQQLRRVALRASLQVGLSTTHSYCDGEPCSMSRSISWASPTEPLYKVVDPGVLFNELTGASSGGSTQKERNAARKSVLDAVSQSASAVRTRLSQADRIKLDEYLSGVRELERRVGDPVSLCPDPARPALPPISAGAFVTNTAEYHKGTHADAMNDLVAWALSCDITPVVSYMLEDERSGFEYSHVPVRVFTAEGSTPGDGVCGDYHVVSSGNDDQFASITHWNVGKVAELCARLAATPDVDGKSVLDNTVVLLGSGMHGMNHLCADLPTLLVGGGGGRLRTDQHLALNNRPMRDLHITLLRDVFGCDVPDFGVNATGAPLKRIDELLA